MRLWGNTVHPRSIDRVDKMVGAGKKPFSVLSLNHPTKMTCGVAAAHSYRDEWASPKMVVTCLALCRERRKRYARMAIIVSWGMPTSLILVGMEIVYHSLLLHELCNQNHVSLTNSEKMVCKSLLRRIRSTF